MEQEDEFREAEAEEGGVRKRKRLVGGGEGEEGGFGCAYDKELLLGDTEGAAVDEEAVAEVMRWLEAEISPPPPEQQQEDLGFVTINGNEESCGPSFSAAASTVMASVDTRAGAPPPPRVPWPWPDPEPEPEPQPNHHHLINVGVGTTTMGGGEAKAVADEEEEEWLARLLNCGPAAALELEVEPEGALLA